MLDPLTSLSLACNIIQLLEAGWKVANGTREVYKSGAGAPAEDVHLDSILEDLSNLTSKFDQPTSRSSGDEKELYSITQKCEKLTVDIRNILQADRAKNPASKRQSFLAVLKSRSHKSEKKELKAKLDDCRNLLNLYLLVINRLEARSRLDDLVEGVQINTNRLDTLRSQISLLKQENQTGLINSNIQTQVEKLVTRSDQMYSHIIKTRILDQLRFERIDDRFEAVTDAHDQTFSWILEPGQKHELINPGKVPFYQWLKSGSGIFHIAGKYGSGKSTLMKLLFKDERTKSYLKEWADEKTLVFAKFFFWKPGVKLQKSIKGLYRSMLFEILSECPDLLAWILPDLFDESAEIFAAFDRDSRLSDKKVKCAFEKIINTPSNLERYRFCFFIDGLDELEETAEEDYLDLVRLLKKWADSSQGVKICLSSREYNAFNNAFDQSQKIRLQDLTADDIALFTRQRLSEFTTGDTHDIVSLILSKANGVFLWVALVVQALRRGYQIGNRLSDLRKKLDTIPEELTDLYRYLLDSIHESDRRKSYCIFAVAIETENSDQSNTNYRQIPILQYSYLEDMLEDPNFLSKMPRNYSPLSAKQISRRLDQAKIGLNGRCQSLLEFKDLKTDRFSDNWRAIRLRQRVIFTHRSIYEFLKAYECNMKKYTDGFSPQSAIWQIAFAELVQSGRESFRSLSEVSENRDEIMYLYSRRGSFEYEFTSSRKNLDITLASILFDFEQPKVVSEMGILIGPNHYQLFIYIYETILPQFPEESRYELLHWFDQVVTEMQQKGGAGIEERPTCFYLFSELENGEENPFISILYLAAYHGYHQYVVPTISADPRYFDSPRHSGRLYRAIEKGLFLEYSKVLPLLEEFCRLLPPNRLNSVESFKTQSLSNISVWIAYMESLIRYSLLIIRRDQSGLASNWVSKNGFLITQSKAIEIFLRYEADPRIWLSISEKKVGNKRIFNVKLTWGRERQSMLIPIPKYIKDLIQYNLGNVEKHDTNHGTITDIDTISNAALFCIYLQSKGREISLKEFMTEHLQLPNSSTISELIDRNMELIASNEGRNVDMEDKAGPVEVGRGGKPVKTW